jgi:hypothetical protein
MSSQGNQSPCRPLRRSRAFLAALALGIALLVVSLGHAAIARRAAAPLVEKRAALVAELSLTDLALFTEARYTRHPSQADLHSAFQDHPMALDHFPTGSLVPAAGWGSRQP